MNTNKQTFDKLMKIVGVLLKGDYFTEKSETEKVESDFIDGFYKVLRVALDVSINDKKFNEFVNSDQKDDAVGTARFLIETLDNEKTYTLMNYYLMNFLLAFSKGAKKESISQIQTMLSTEELVPQGFATISENYRSLTSKSA